MGSLIFLGLLFWRIDLRDTLEAFKLANYWYLVPAVGSYFVSLAFRTLRWRVMLRPLQTVSFRRLFPVVSVGYMANNLLPVRLGELVRSYYLGRREGVSKSSALATIVVERVLDGLVLLLFLVVVSAFLPLAGLVRDLATDAGIPRFALLVATTVPFGLVMGLLFVAAHRPAWPMRLLAAGVRVLPSGIAAKLLGIAGLFLGGLAFLREPRHLGGVVLISLPVWLGEAAVAYMVGVGFGLSGVLGGAGAMAAVMLAVTAIANLATALPSSQGGIGPFEFFATATLVVLGVGREVATAYAVVLHVSLLAPVTAVGLAYLWVGKDSLVQMVRLGVKGERAEAHASLSDLAASPEETS